VVKAELSYNPYLLETVVKFNGKEPKVNSAVEKYEHAVLQDWIQEMPEVFRDEMNGYDFDLDFSGTELDFEKVKESFNDAHVSESDVRIFHKNVLESRDEKLAEIRSLVNWLEENPNGRFDFEKFKSENEDDFDDETFCVVIHGESIKEDEKSADLVEHVESIGELRETDITNTPIIFNIEYENMNLLQTELEPLLKRSDVESGQIFFIVDRDLDSAEVKRTIQDIGIRYPNMVSGVDDVQVQDYLDAYQKTLYIAHFVKTMRSETGKIEAGIDAAKKRSADTTERTYDMIESRENKISKMRAALEKFVRKDNLSMPEQVKEVTDKLYSSINTWNTRRTKITDIQEAERQAQSFEERIKSYYKEFNKSLSFIKGNEERGIRLNLQEWYKTADEDKSYLPKLEVIDPPAEAELPSIAGKLMELGKERYVKAKEDILDKFLKAGEEKEVLVTEFFCEDWRNHAKEAIKPCVEETIDSYFEYLNNYYDGLAALYQNHLEELITQEVKEKDEMASRLSEEEKEIQRDGEWLAECTSQLEKIEGR